jgi:hypothetical protein
MSLSLRSRVRRIERVAHDHEPGQPCPACGHTPGTPGTPGITTQRMVLCTDDDCGPDHCPECGRRIVLHLTFDELDP